MTDADPPTLLPGCTGATIPHRHPEPSSPQERPRIPMHARLNPVREGRPAPRAITDFSGRDRAGSLPWMPRCAVVLLVALLLEPALSGRQARAGVRFDLVELVASDPAPPAGVRVVFRGAHGQTRTSVRMPLPGSVSYPVEIPADATLSFGHALSVAAFMVETPDLAEPARFLVRFEESDGGPVHVLFDRHVDLRRVATDRGWFDEKIDLGALAGKSGTLTFAVENEGDAEKAAQADIFWSSPRILPKASPTERNLLFITIDCLRADHLGAHGYPRDTTPRLDALARHGIRFANAFANAPMTLPSIPQIFTSRVFPTRDHETLTSPIARAGISNAAYVNNAWIPLWLSQGGHADPPGTFDRLVSGDLDASAITDGALAWLDLHRGERFALYLHYLDAHTPYSPPREYVERYADPSYDGPIRAGWGDAEGASAGKYTAADRQQIVALYDGAIGFIDDQIGRLLDALRRSGRLEHTIVVVSADHGEEFWDHGRFFHGQSLYDELLHVPLIVHLPAGAEAGTVVERPVRAIDIAPSILEWLSLPRPEGFTGEPLSRALAAPGKDGPPLFATATQAQFPTRYAIRTRSQKLIESLDSGRLELYAVSRDPAEKDDTAGVALADARPLVERLDASRRILRERGYQVQMVGPKTGEVDVHIRLEGHPKSGTFLTLDRRSGEPRPRITVSPDGMDLDVTAKVGAAGSGFRFDRLPNPRSFMRKDLVRVAVEVGGEPVSREVIARGAEGRPPRTNLIDLRNRSLETTREPSCPPPDEGVRVCLWRFPGEKFLAIPEIKDPEVREKLRALGYLQ